MLVMVWQPVLFRSMVAYDGYSLAAYAGQEYGCLR
jgi:hypothetical protein